MGAQCGRTACPLRPVAMLWQRHVAVVGAHHIAICRSQEAIWASFNATRISLIGKA